MILKAIKRTGKQLGGEEIYEEVSNCPASLLKTIKTIVAKIRNLVDLKRFPLDYNFVDGRT